MEFSFGRMVAMVSLIGFAFFVFAFEAKAANNEQTASVADGSFSLSSAWSGALNVGSNASVKSASVSHTIGTAESILTLLPTKTLSFSYIPTVPSAVLDGGIFNDNPLIGQWSASLSDRSSCSASPSLFSVGPDQYSFVLCGIRPSVSLASNNSAVVSCSGMTCTAVAPGNARITATIAGTPIAIFGNKSGDASWLQLVSATLPSATLSWNVSVVLPPTLTFSMSGTNPIPNNTGTTLSWSATNVIPNTSCQASGDWSGAKAASGTFDTGNLQARRDYTLKCTGPSGDTVEGTVTVLVGSATSAPQFTFSSTASAGIVPYNTSATLSWNVLNPSDTIGCEATLGDWAMLGSRPLSGSENTGNLTRTSAPYVYILSCFGPSGSQAKQITIQVAQPASPPNIRTLSVDPDHIFYGDSATLTWDVQYANQCTASTDSVTPIADWDGIVPFSGSRIISGLEKTTKFQLSCMGAGGTKNRSVSVIVEPINLQPPSITFWADDSWVPYNQSTIFHWKVERADWCEASGGWYWWTDTNFEDYLELDIPTSRAYTITCGNLSDTSDMTIFVSAGSPPGAVTVSLVADPYMVDYGGETQVTWNSTNAQWCYMDRWIGTSNEQRINDVSISGYELWGNITETETDRITCMNTLGSQDQALITIGINANSIPIPPDPNVDPPSIVLTSDASFVSYNTSTILRWNVTGADSCVASNDRGLISWNGPRPLSGSATTGNIEKNTYFYLQCTGPGGTSDSDVRVRVGSSSEPGPTLSFWADDLSVLSGQSTRLHWTSGNAATSCVASGDWAGAQMIQSPVVGIDTGALTTSKSYQLRCWNAVGSVLATVNVIVGGSPLLPAMSFYVDNYLVPLGGSTILRWNTQNVKSCTATSDPLSLAWTGSVPLLGGADTGVLLSAGEYIYTLTCTNGLSGPENTISMKAHVFAGVAVATGPETKLFADGEIIQFGTSPVLHYSSNYASQCSLLANGNILMMLPFLNGIVEPGPITENTLYTLSCSDTNGAYPLASVSNLSIKVGNLLLCPDVSGQSMKPGDTRSFQVWYVEDSSATCDMVAVLGGIDVTNAPSSDITWEVVSPGVSFTGLPGEIQADSPGIAEIRVSYRPSSGVAWFSRQASILVGRPIDCYECNRTSATCRGETQYDFVNDPPQCSTGTTPSLAACEISCSEKKWEEVAP